MADAVFSLKEMMTNSKHSAAVFCHEDVRLDLKKLLSDLSRYDFSEVLITSFLSDLSLCFCLVPIVIIHCDT